VSSYYNHRREPGNWGDITRHIVSADRVLDLGCGLGWLGDHVNDYTGIDVSIEGLRAAQQAGRRVVLADAGARLPFAPGSFTMVVAKDVLEHVDNPVQVVCEIRRVLCPGGRVLATTPDAQRWVWNDYTHRRPFPRSTLRRLFNDNHFRVAASGWASVAPGSARSAKWSATRRQLAPYRLIALIPWVRRNTWVLATAIPYPRGGPQLERRTSGS